LANFQSSEQDVFYKEGSLTLDWDKLGHYIGGDYTADEIESYKRGAADRRGTSVEHPNSTNNDSAQAQLEDNASTNPSTAPGNVNGGRSDESSMRASKRPRVGGTSASRAEGDTQDSSAGESTSQGQQPTGYTASSSRFVPQDLQSWFLSSSSHEPPN
jgi:hypothetical protein